MCIKSEITFYSAIFLLQQPGSIAARHGRRISQGDQILEINGNNVRESNQKDVAHMIQVIFDKLNLSSLGR